MEIKVLGSVSPYCKGNKNCPGFLVIEGKEKVLLDCGNGSTSQMSMPEDLENLTIIISHLHKDHYGDLLSIAYASYVYHKLGYLDKKIPVYLPKPSFMKGENNTPDIDKAKKGMESEIMDYDFLTHLGKEQYLEFRTYDDSSKIQIGQMQLTFSKNPHPTKTYSTKITTEKESIVYTSDTGYEKNTIESFARGVDLLICESTFIRGQQKKEDFHLYAYEAGVIAKRAEVKQLVLTHFWPELNKSLYAEEAKEEFSNTIVAKEGKYLKIKNNNKIEN